MVVEVVCVACRTRQPLVSALEAEASRDAWTAALAVVSGADFAAQVAAYVDWFAPAEKVPQTRTVVRVLEDLTARMRAGSVRSQGIVREAPLGAWVDGMRLIVGGATKATRPLKTNGYLAGIVWQRAGEPALRALESLPVPAAVTLGAAEPPRRGLDRAHLLGELKVLRGLLPGANTASAQESLRRQISDLEGRLDEAAGVDHGVGS